MRIPLIVWACLWGMSEATDYNVLFLGNSYTERNAMTDIVKDLAAKNGDTITVTKYAQNNGQLTQYYHDAQINTDFITGKTYDVVVIQEQSSNPARPIPWVQENTYLIAEALVAKFREGGKTPRIIFYDTWGRPGRHEEDGLCESFTPFCSYDGMQIRLTETYQTLAFNVKPAEVAPVGETLKYMKDVVDYNFYEKLFYDSDRTHPTLVGSYMIASVLAQKITKKINKKDNTMHLVTGVDNALGYKNP